MHSAVGTANMRIDRCASSMSQGGANKLGTKPQLPGRLWSFRAAAGPAGSAVDCCCVSFASPDALSQNLYALRGKNKKVPAETEGSTSSRGKEGSTTAKACRRDKL